MVFCLPFPPAKEGDGAVTNDVGAREGRRRERAGGGDADERRRRRHRPLFPFALPLAAARKAKATKGFGIDDVEAMTTQKGVAEGEKEKTVRPYILHTYYRYESLQYSVTNAVWSPAVTVPPTAIRASEGWGLTRRKGATDIR
jgi:hypothetical protein